MYRPHKSRTAILIFCELMLFALACTCGPLNTFTQVRTTLGAIQLTLAPAMTELAMTMTVISPTGEAALKTLEAEVPELVPSLTNIAGGILPSNGLPQWATSATATAERSTSDWSAMQAAGEPNTTTCGDAKTAWASGSTSGAAELTLIYDTPVVPTGIAIYEAFNPGAITKVEVVDEAGVHYTVYQGQAAPVAQCPNVMTIDVTNVTARVRTVIITVAQTAAGNWDEIDAVQLTGTP